MIYADIIVDISHEKLDRSFQYRVPKELEAEIQLGMVVTIPFGNGNHERKGYVTGLSDKPAFDISKMKELHGICSSEETTEAPEPVSPWLCICHSPVPQPAALPLPHPYSALYNVSLLL